MSNLPTREEMLANAQRKIDEAYRLLGDASDWLRPDWRPLGSALTAEQARQTLRMCKAIAAAKRALNEGR